MKILNIKKLYILLVLLVLVMPFSVNADRTYEVTVNTNDTQYYAGETVIISGKLTNDGQGVPSEGVCIDIKDPNGATLFSACMPTNSQGRFSANYALSSSAKEGEYTIIAKSESHGVTDSTDFNVVSTDIEVNAHGEYYGLIGEEIRFTGSANGGKKPYSWEWDFGDGTTRTSQNPSHIYYDTDTFTVELIVEDRGGYTGTETTSATVAEVLTVDANGPYGGVKNIDIAFEGTAQGGFPPYTWEWDFGDGNTSNEQNPFYSYQSSGQYIGTLTVTDDKNNEEISTASVNVQDENNPPENPQIDGPLSGNINEEYTYTLSSTDLDNHDIYYYIEWGDGETTTTDLYNSGEIVEATHTWEEKGDYVIRAKAIDENNAESGFTTIEVSMPRSKVISSLLEKIINFLERILLKVTWIDIPITH